VDFAMMSPAQRHGELVADLAPKRAASREPQMMRVARSAAANEARLMRYISDVIPITDPAGLW
jgi:hypothetical protein